MAQPSVAREPSMEEILASIRRIIESNEPAGEGASQRDFSDYSDDADVASAAEEIDFGPEMAANDPGVPAEDAAPLTQDPAPVAAAPSQQAAAPIFAPQSQGPAQPSVAVPERSLSLADVAARVRAASGRTAEPLDVPAPAAAEKRSYSSQAMPPIPELGPEPGPEPEAAPEVKGDFEPDFGRQRDRRDDYAASPSRPALRGMDRASDRPQFEAAADTRPVVDAHLSAEPVVAEQPKSETLPAKIEAAATLMSAEAGAQVARSFGELADVLDGFDQQSVEEMAQDMLRPMLQEWLDDNLPTLVERLVREEIERVARGPRR